jgi:hypothetical protein
LTAVAVAAVSRLFVFVVAVVSASAFGERPSCSKCWNIQVPLVNLFSRYDSAYYVNIAWHGYGNLIGPRWAFFPGYPIVIGSVGRLAALVSPLPLVLTLYVVGFAVSNIAFFGCIYYLYKLSIEVLGDKDLAFYSALCLAFYPAGVFLSATYSESLFLLLMLSSLYYWRIGRFGITALLAFFEALTRPVGILLVIPFLIDLARGKAPRRVASYLPIAAVPLAFLIFLAFSQLAAGTPFASFIAERLYWGITPTLPLIAARTYHAIIHNPITVGCYLAIAIGGLLTSILRRKNDMEGTIDVYGLALLVTYPYAGLISVARYTVTLIPVYFGCARWMQRSKTLTLAIFLILLAIGVGLFANWYRFY